MGGCWLGQLFYLSQKKLWMNRDKNEKGFSGIKKGNLKTRVFTNLIILNTVFFWLVSDFFFKPKRRMKAIKDLFLVVFFHIYLIQSSIRRNTSFNFRPFPSVCQNFPPHSTFSERVLQCTLPFRSIKILVRACLRTDDSKKLSRTLFLSFSTVFVIKAMRGPWVRTVHILQALSLGARVRLVTAVPRPHADTQRGIQSMREGREAPAKLWRNFSAMCCYICTWE